MIVYLSSPGSQMHADHLRGMPVLLSYGVAAGKTWLDGYAPSFGRLLVDSGAFSEFNSSKKVDLGAYADWAKRYKWADAVAALDDIRGDWEKGLSNWRQHPEMFPTYHDSDPPEALDAILPFNPKWIGLGMVPPRTNGRWLDETLARIPPEIHCHGWALGGFADRPRLNSIDSTGWMRDAWKVHNDVPWLTHAECVEIIVKRYQRAGREVRPKGPSGQEALF